MNQIKAFYLLSIIAIFFIGYSYSQFNIEPTKPEVIIINNNDAVEEYKSNILKLQLQLEKLDSLLIEALDGLKTIKQKLSISSSKNQILESELNSSQNAYQLINLSLNDRENKLLNSEKSLNELRGKLFSAELEIELTKFELELAEEQLKAK